MNRSQSIGPRNYLQPGDKLKVMYTIELSNSSKSHSKWFKNKEFKDTVEEYYLPTIMGDYERNLLFIDENTKGVRFPNVTANIKSVNTNYRGKILTLTINLNIIKSTCKYYVDIFKKKHKTYCESIQPRKFAFYMLLNAIHDRSSGGLDHTNVEKISSITFDFKGRVGTIKRPEVYNYNRNILSKQKELKKPGSCVIL